MWQGCEFFISFSMSRLLDLRREEIVSCSFWAIALPSTISSNLIKRASATNGSFSPQSFLQQFTNNPSFKSKHFSPVVHCVGKRPTPLNHEAQRYCHQILKRVQNEYVNMCGLCLPKPPFSLLHAPQFDVDWDEQFHLYPPPLFYHRFKRISESISHSSIPVRN